MKVALRCLFVEKYKKFWKNLLLDVKYALNTAKNVFITTTFFELLYDVKFREIITFLLHIFKVNAFAKKFVAYREIIRNEVYEIIKFAQIKMTFIYDVKHWIFNLFKKIYLKMMRTENVDYHFFNNLNFSIKKIKSFRIKRKVNDLTYELKFSKHMRIHNVISIIHLKQTHLDDHEKNISILDSIKHDEKELYVIDRIIKNEKRNDELKYIVKWKNYREIT